jgi:hypothetical protein
MLFYLLIGLSPQSAYSLILMSYLSTSASFLKTEFSYTFGIIILVNSISKK